MTLYKKWLIAFILVCVILILLNIFAQVEISTEKNQENYGSANSGIGVALLTIYSIISTAVISGILLILHTFISWKSDRILSKSSIWVGVLILLTAISPIILVYFNID